MKGNLLFVGGDLSGIQKFIYNITSKKAMVSLKGRSQYLKDFTEKVYNEILSIPELDKSSIDKNEMKIYCSGGKFYLQVPDTDGIRNAIADIRHKTEKALWDEHQGQLSMNIDFVPFCYDGELVKVEDEKGNIGILWRHIAKKFNALQNQKFKSILLEQPQDFFDVKQVGGEANVCQITGIENAIEKSFRFNEGEESLWVLESVSKQIDLGIKLRDQQHFKMLEEYAGDSYLGVLRMDVDGLGARFIQGFGSMKEYKRFSSALNQFFDAEKGNLHDIQKSFDDYLNIVYAGGDDIFTVGRWDKVIDFAEKVQKEFKDFCKHDLKDETLSISGGIAIVNPKFPIAKAAELSGEAEDSAKRYNHGKKNAFNMLGETISWKDEFDYVKSYKEQFVTLINNSGLSRSILHKIMVYANMVKRNKAVEEENRKGNMEHKPDLSYVWHTTYYLTRFMGKEKNNAAVYYFCKDLRDKQLLTPEKFRLISLAARWAELELREVQQSNNQ